ncbi:MAG: hypothetical protein ACE5MI_12360 [Acidimicrobiia bacterium]
MNSVRVPAAGFGLAAMMVIGAACGGAVAQVSGSVSQEPVAGPSDAEASRVGPASSPDGPLDTALAEVTVLSVEDDTATLRIRDLRDYIRSPIADFPQLGVGDEVLVRVYNVAPLGDVADAVATGVRAGEAPRHIPEPVLTEGESYLADMSACFSGVIDGLSCPFEGWSVAIYPLRQLPGSTRQDSTATPPSTTPPFITAERTQG